MIVYDEKYMKERFKSLNKKLSNHYKFISPKIKLMMTMGKLTDTEKEILSTLLDEYKNTLEKYQTLKKIITALNKKIISYAGLSNEESITLKTNNLIEHIKHINIVKSILLKLIRKMNKKYERNINFKSVFKSL